MKNFLAHGKCVQVPAPRALNGGDLVVVGMLAGVAGHAAANTAPVEVHLEGIYSLAKTSAQAWAVGAAIYATAAGVATTVATGNVLLGVAVEAAANPSATGVVRLNGAAPAAVGA